VEEKELRIKVFVLPASKFTPTALVNRVKSFRIPVEVRRKSYGLLLRGKAENIGVLMGKLRELDPYRVFFREAGLLPRGKRVFKGFLQLSGEYAYLLPLVSNALEEVLGRSGEGTKAGRHQEEIRMGFGGPTARFGESTFPTGGTTFLSAESTTQEKTGTLSHKLVRCAYVKEYVEAVLIDHGEGNVEVRCPDFMLPSGHICQNRCPYGKINVWI